MRVPSINWSDAEGRFVSNAQPRQSQPRLVDGMPIIRTMELIVNDRHMELQQLANRQREERQPYHSQAENHRHAFDDDEEEDDDVRDTAIPTINFRELVRERAQNQRGRSPGSSPVSSSVGSTITFLRRLAERCGKGGVSVCG